MGQSRPFSNAYTIVEPSTREERLLRDLLNISVTKDEAIDAFLSVYPRREDVTKRITRRPSDVRPS